jgi:hypothetical protein
MDLPLPVEGVASSQPIGHPPCQTLTGPSRFFQCVLPRAVQLHNLGAVHQASAGEGHHVGLLLAPPCQGSGPLLGAARLVELLTIRDHAAIDETRDDGRQVPRGDRDHGLVQQPETLLDTPLPDQRVALLMYGEGEQVCIAESLGDLGGVGCGAGRSLPITGGHTTQQERYQQIASLDALILLAFDQPLRATEPAGRAARFSSECKNDA